jgi:hypothetical protein
MFDIFSRKDNCNNNIEKDQQQNSLDDEKIADIIDILKPYCQKGIRNDFLMCLSGWLRKEYVPIEAAFKKKPAIPSEYWIPLYGIIVSTVVGWSIPSIITWRKSKKQITRLNSYHQELTSLYDDGKLDERDIIRLNTLNNNITDAYSEGKVNNEQYANLKREISVLYQEIFNKRLDSLKKSPEVDGNLTDKIKDDITDAYSKGKITELHYNILNERISKMIAKDDTHNST